MSSLTRVKIGHKSSFNWSSELTYKPLTLPFPFPYFEKNFDSIFVYPNGFITFYNPGESVLEEVAEIAPLKDNFNDNESLTVTYGTNEHEFIVQWMKKLRNLTFELILGRNGEITFKYISIPKSLR